MSKWKSAEKTENSRTLNKKATPKTPSIQKIATARLQDSDIWYDVFRFVRHDRAIAFVILTASNASSSAKLANALRDAGAQGCNHYSFASVVSTLSTTSVTSRGQIVIRGGWAIVGTHFALPDKMMVATSIKSKKLKKFICLDFDGRKPWQLAVRNGSPGVSHLNIGVSGTVDQWKEKVARPALSSSSMMTAICAAFAAPLLRLTSVAPFTAMLSGKSTGGKTTTTLVAASVIGLGDEASLCNWNMTPAGLEQRAEIHFDMLLPIDDLNNAEGTDKDRFKLITTVPYRITAGSKKFTLTTAKTGITGRPPVSGGIATIILTSSEETVGALALKANATLKAGIHGRLLELPIKDPSQGGVYDRLQGLSTADERVKAGRKLSKQIAKACGRYHGAIFRFFLAAIIDGPDNAKKIVEQGRQAFLKVVKVDRGDAVQMRHAEAFAFLYAAGLLAIDLNALPWTENELLDGLAASHRRSRTLIPKRPNTRADGLARLRIALSDPKRVTPVNLVRDIADIDGWRSVSGAYATYVFFGKTFRALFSSKAQRRIVEDYLQRKSILIPGQDGPTKQPVHPVSGKKVPRCYEFRVPLKGENPLTGRNETLVKAKRAVPRRPMFSSDAESNDD